MNNTTDEENGSREMLFLVRCCGRDRPADPPDGLDWSRIAALAVRHRVVPLLYRALTAGNRTGLRAPADAFEHIRGLHFASAVRSLRIAAETARVAVYLSERRLRAFPFKGPALAALLYGDLSARTVSDADFLVHPEDLFAAKEALAGKGYGTARALSPRQERACVRAGWGFNLTDPSGEVVVNLRRRATPDYLPGALDWDALWAECREAEFEGTKVKIPARETLLMLLCCHGAKHCWDSLLWLADADRLVRGEGKPLDWNAVWKTAGASCAARTVALGLTLARNLFSTPVPDGPGMTLPEGEPPDRAVAYCLKKLFAEQANVRSAFRDRLFHLGMRSRAADRAAHTALEILRPSLGDFEMLRLPDSLFPLYYPLRPVLLGLRILRS